MTDDLARLKQFCAERGIAIRPFKQADQYGCRSYVDGSFCGVSYANDEAEAIWEELDRIAGELSALADSIREELIKK